MNALDELPYAHGEPLGMARIRQYPEDFKVQEDLGYQAEGEGEHVFLLIRKRNLNTQDVVRRLARLARVRDRDIGFAGRKDRLAETTQSFSVYLPGRPDPDWRELQDAQLQILEVARHRRKIRRGSLKGNRFRLLLRDLQAERMSLQERLQWIATDGVPNYFAEQRFGRGGGNLDKAAALFADSGRRPKRHLRGLLISAARSWVFNQLLAERVRQGNWNRLLDGDVLQLAGSYRQFVHDPDDADIPSRLAAADIHPSGPLPGRPAHALVPVRAAARLEERILGDNAQWVDGLQRLGVDQARRPLRVLPGELHWQFEAAGLRLTFFLPAGAYATAVLRELLYFPS